MTRKQSLKLFAILVGIAVAAFAALIGARVIKYTQGSIRALPLAFQEAYSSGDMMVFRLLLLLGSDIDRVRPGVDYTLLGMAAYSGDTDSVEQLLDLGADPNAPYDTWQRPLFAAIVEGHDNTANRLIERGATLEFVDAVFWGDAKTARSMFAADPGLMDGIRYRGRSPLFVAYDYNEPEAAKLLIEFGADPAEPTRLGTSLLDYVRQKNDTQWIVLLDETPENPERTVHAE